MKSENESFQCGDNLHIILLSEIYGRHKEDGKRISKQPHEEAYQKSKTTKSKTSSKVKKSSTKGQAF